MREEKERGSCRGTWEGSVQGGRLLNVMCR